ncbi:hypothetical protein BJX64DRAFT_248885 [Aspergillus heterothallicus]
MNELLLLTIQSVCNAEGIRIPWAEVARVMQHKTTEGAIVQHLTKLRKRRVEAEKAVPPPLKRCLGGSRSRAPSASLKRNTRSRTENSQVESWESSDQEGFKSKGQRRKESHRNARTPYRQLPGLEYEDDSNDSDEEMLVPGADFLQLPYDRDRTKKPPSLAPEPESEPSLVVALKCPKWFRIFGQDAALISPASTSFVQTSTSTNCISRTSGPTSPNFPTHNQKAVGQDSSTMVSAGASFGQPPSSSNFFFPASNNDAILDPYVDYENGAVTEDKFAPTEHWPFGLPEIGLSDAPFNQFPDLFEYNTFPSIFPEDFSPGHGYGELLDGGMSIDALQGPGWKPGQ